MVARDRLLPWAVGLVPALAVIARTPEVSPDTASYLANSSSRPPVYPLLLDLASLLPASVELRAVIAAQVLLTVWGAVRLARWFARSFGTSRLPEALVVLVAAMPAFLLGTWVLTDVLAYALLLHAVVPLLEALQTRAARPLVAAATLLALAMMTRPHYLFAVPPLLAVAGALLVWRRRAAVASVAGSIAILLAISPVQRLYHLAVSGEARSSSLLGIQLLTVAAYVSAPEDAAAVQDADARALTSEVLAAIRAEGLTPEQAAHSLSPYSHFRAVYNDICWKIVVPRWKAAHAPDRRSTLDDLDAMNRATTGAALDLFRAHPLRLLAHMGRQLQAAEGLLLVLFAAFLLVAATRAAVSRGRDPYWTPALAVGLLHASNLCLVVLVEPPMPRYTFPTGTLLVVTVLAGLARSASLPPAGSTPLEGTT